MIQNSPIIDFEPAYLAALTRRGLKPLSRWEGPLHPRARTILRRLGLQVREIRRFTRAGRPATEWIFSASEECLELYARVFEGKPLGEDPAEARLAGRLFGYPSCCVESFVKHGYTPNSLPPEDQRILFHWACPDCALSPLLLPGYRLAHTEARRWVETGRFPKTALSMNRRRSLAALAASLAAGLALVGRTGEPADRHQIPLDPGADPDGDLLASAEERALDMNPRLPDEDGNKRLDGVDISLELAALLDALPETPQADRPYVVHHPAFGLETCAICGELINMGFMTVVNPREKTQINLPYIARHYIEHGAFSYNGSEHEGRVDPARLWQVLLGSPDPHQAAVSPDGDRDRLTDEEEADLGKNSTNPDENANGLLDGPELARALAAEIKALPPKPGPESPGRLDFQLKGLERCEVCGQNVNMGWLTVVNPAAGLYAKTPYIALHAMEHGSFSFTGNVHGEAREKVWLLERTLHSKGPSHQRKLLGDSDGDGLLDFEEARFGCKADEEQSFSDGVPDGFRVARALWEETTALPHLPNLPVHAEPHMLRGVVPCDICGELVNMGWLEVVNRRENLRIQVPYLALHFMRHGGFAYTASQRLNPILLDIALHGDGTSHLVLPKEDRDQDGLTEAEEAWFGLDPTARDTRGFGVPDGVVIARRLAAQIQALPDRPQPGGLWRMEIPADCYAPCPVCGESVNCGLLELHNERIGRTLTISLLQWHFLQRGGFGPAPDNRVDPISLDSLLQAAVVLRAQGGKACVRWFGRQDRLYQLLTAPSLAGPWISAGEWKGKNAEIEFEEPIGTGTRFYKLIAR